jgi:hypothetical protein
LRVGKEKRLTPGRPGGAEGRGVRVGEAA